MTVSDFEYIFRDKSHIGIGDGLISVHTRDYSKVINALGETILELTTDEYCINAKNGCYLIANRKDEKFHIVNSKSEVIKMIDSKYLSVLESREYYVSISEESYTILVLDYSGRTIYEYSSELNGGFVEAHQISSSIISLEFYPDFDDRDFYNDKFNKSIVVNIATNQIIRQGTREYNRDKTVICDVSEFELPVETKNENKFHFGATEETITILIPVVKYTVVEPDYDEDGKLVYHKHVEFCDFAGKIILKTEYSAISDRKSGFYLVERQPQVNKDTVYGILDSTFRVLLPCQYPKLTIRDKNIVIEHPNWSDWQDSVLDVQSKRFIVQKKNGSKSILLPYTYSSCSEGIDGLDNSNLLTAYRYDQEGRYCKGIINYDGDELLPANYNNLYVLTENLLEAYEFDKYRSTQLVYIVDKDVILRNKYIKVETDDFNYHGRYFRVRVLDQTAIFKVKVGLIDDDGKEILPPIYDYVFFPREDKVCYIKDGIPGWIDLNDDSIHEYPRFSLIRPFKMGVASFSKDSVIVKSLSIHTEQLGYDHDNDCVCYGPVHWDDVCGDLSIQFQGTSHKEGLIDMSGNIILNAEYSEIVREINLDNLIFVKGNYEWGVVNCSGEFIIPMQYEWYSTDSDNFSDDFENAAFCCGTDTQVDYYDENAELIDSEDIRMYNQRGYSQYESEDNCNYDRDTYYALGGDDYDAFKEQGGSIDDMMDGMGY